MKTPLSKEIIKNIFEESKRIHQEQGKNTTLIMIQQFQQWGKNEGYSMSEVLDMLNKEINTHRKNPEHVKVKDKKRPFFRCSSEEFDKAFGARWHFNK